MYYVTNFIRIYMYLDMSFINHNITTKWHVQIHVYTDTIRNVVCGDRSFNKTLDTNQFQQDFKDCLLHKGTYYGTPSLFKDWAESAEELQKRWSLKTGPDGILHNNKTVARQLETIAFTWGHHFVVNDRNTNRYDWYQVVLIQSTKRCDWWQRHKSSRNLLDRCSNKSGCLTSLPMSPCWLRCCCWRLWNLVVSL